MIEKKIDKMIGKTIVQMGLSPQILADPKQIRLIREMIRQVYLDLIKVTFRSGLVWHIPVPLFLENQLRIDYYKSLPGGRQERGSDYFVCPICNKPRFYDGPCNDQCRKKTPGIYWRDRRQEYREKGRFLAMIDRGVLPKSVKTAVYVRARRESQ